LAAISENEFFVTFWANDEVKEQTSPLLPVETGGLAFQ